VWDRGGASLFVPFDTFNGMAEPKRSDAPATATSGTSPSGTDARSETGKGHVTGDQGTSSTTDHASSSTTDHSSTSTTDHASTSTTDHASTRSPDQLSREHQKSAKRTPPKGRSETKQRPPARKKVRAQHDRSNPPAETEPARQIQPKGTLDLIIVASLAVIAAFAAALLPEGNIARMVLVLPALFFAPGYLLLQALPIPIFSRWSRAVHGFLAIGISPAIVGLLALSTSLVPGGFRPIPIIAVVTLATLAFAGVALYRRSIAGTPRGTPQVA
jgi:cation transport ATPase